jgi:choline kinase
VPTTAIVLAAGLGRRLSPATPLPKWLAPAGATTPCEQQLGACAGLPLREVVAVVGPGLAAIDDAVAPWRDRLSIRLLENPLHHVRNNWYSVLLALESVAPDDDVLVFNSDLFAAASWLREAGERLLACGEPAGLGLDVERPLTDEAMKCSAEDGLVRRIGKVGVDQPRGEYVGISWWSAASAAELHGHLARFLDEDGAVDNWYEHGVDDHLRAGARYAAVPVPSVDWVEIDDPSDLEVAIRLAAAGG